MKLIFKAMALTLLCINVYAQQVNVQIRLTELMAEGDNNDGAGLQEPFWHVYARLDGQANWVHSGCFETTNAYGDWWNIPNFTFYDVSNSNATFVNFEMEGGENDCAGVGGTPCAYESGFWDCGANDDDNHAPRQGIQQGNINFRNDPSCQWNEYTIHVLGNDRGDADHGDYYAKVEIRWEYSNFDAGSAITSCGTTASLNATGNGTWSIISGAGGSFGNTSAPNSTFNGTTGETYNLQYTSLAGCISPGVTDNVTVTFNTPTTPNLTADDISVCEGNDISFTSTGGVNYDYQVNGTSQSNGANNQWTASNLDDGDIVSVTMTDANNCITTEQLTAVIYPLPNVDLGADITKCTEANTSIDATTPFATYQWNTSETSAVITPNAIGQYDVLVTDGNGCTDRDTIVVSNFAVTPLDLGADLAVCPGDSVQVDAGNAFNTYTWSHGPTTSAVYLSSAATYTLNAIDANGCTSTDAIALTENSQPTINLTTGSAVICDNESIAFTANAGYDNYQFFLNDNSVYSGSINSINLNNLTDQDEIKVIVTNGSNCSAIDSSIIDVETSPVVTLPNDTTICPGETINLDATTPFVDYLWNDNSTSATLEVTSAGEYIVNVTSMEGCTDADTINVGIHNQPVVDLGADQTICLGDSVELNAGNFASYTWSTGETTQTIYADTFGLITVNVIDANGCSANDEVQLTPIQGGFNLGNDTIIYSGAELQITAEEGLEYTWSNGANTQSITVNPTEPTTYSVDVLNVNGCTFSGEIFVDIDNSLNIFIPNMFSPNGDNSNDEFKLYGYGVQTIQLDIYNKFGQLVYTTNDVNELINNGWDGTFNGTPQPAGSYIWKLEGTTILGSPIQLQNDNKGSVLLTR